jgi:hypothetical protein
MKGEIQMTQANLTQNAIPNFERKPTTRKSNKNMTKKHFIRLADYIRDAQHGQDDTLPRFTDRQIDLLADFCSESNPRFNRDRWIGYIDGKNGKNGGRIKG